MTFKEFYQQLRAMERPLHPARQFILTLSQKTGKTPKTIQQWMSGVYTPSPESKLIISEETGIPIEELFP